MTLLPSCQNNQRKQLTFYPCQSAQHNATWKQHKTDTITPHSKTKQVNYKMEQKIEDNYCWTRESLVQIVSFSNTVTVRSDSLPFNYENAEHYSQLRREGQEEGIIDKHSLLES